MDISKALDTKTAANEGRKMTVLQTDGSIFYQDDGVTPVTITLLGADSDFAFKRTNDIQDQRAQRYSRTKMFTTSAAAYQDGTRVLAELTVSWDGIMSGGKPVECTRENAFELYTTIPALRRQVQEFVDNEKNFSTASQTP
jgi:hypothetical protein